MHAYGLPRLGAPRGPMTTLATAYHPALAAWRAELAAGKRTIRTADDLWPAAGWEAAAPRGRPRRIPRPGQSLPPAGGGDRGRRRAQPAGGAPAVRGRASDRAPPAPVGRGDDPMTAHPWRTLAEILDDPQALAPPEAVVPRLAWRGRVTLLAAREKDGKSTIATAGAAAVTRGTPFLDGKPGDPAAVLWVAVEEHPHDLAQRAVQFGADPDRLVVLGLTDEPLETLRAAVADVKPALLVIDTLPTWADRWVEDARSATSWTPVMVALTALARESDAALLILHHSRKSDGAYRDSSAIGAGVDVILEMSRHPEDPNLRTVKARGRWPMQGFVVRLVGDGFELGGGTLSLDARVLLFVERNPGATGKAVRDGAGGRAGDVDDALRRLVDRGAVRDAGSGERHEYYLAGAPLQSAPGVALDTVDEGARDEIRTTPLVLPKSLRDKARTTSGRGESSRSQTTGGGHGTSVLLDTARDLVVGRPDLTYEQLLDALGPPEQRPATEAALARLAADGLAVPSPTGAT